MAEIIECDECLSEDLEWNVSTRTNGVGDGRLRAHDVSAVAYLGCNECSKTLAVIDGDTIARVLNELRSRP